MLLQLFFMKLKKRKRKTKTQDNVVEGDLAKGEGGVVAPPLVLDAALVVTAVCLRWFLGQERIGQKTRTRVFWAFWTTGQFTCSIHCLP